MNRRTLLASVALVAAMAGMAPAAAQDASPYPERPVTIVVPYAPGGSTDAVARFIAPKLSEHFGQPFVVENMPGASGVIGTDSIAKADPDGYRILVHTSVIGIHPAFKSDLAYNTEEDIAAASVIAQGPWLLNANPELPVDNVQELIDYAKENPGVINFGSAGAGSSGHLITELFMEQTGTDMVHIPYAGGGPSQIGLMANEVQVVFDTLTSIPFVEEGRLKALAVTSEERWEALPDVPTMAEQGFEDAADAIWIGAFVPEGTPEEILTALSEGIAEAVSDENVVDQLFGVGLVPVGSTPAEAEERLSSDIAKWQALANSGVTLD